MYINHWDDHLHLLSGCFVEAFCSHTVFLMIYRTGIDTTWLQHLLTLWEVSRNHLLKMLGTLKMSELLINNNNIIFYYIITMQLYRIVTENVWYTKLERKDVRNLAGIYVLPKLSLSFSAAKLVLVLPEKT